MTFDTREGGGGRATVKIPDFTHALMLNSESTAF